MCIKAAMDNLLNFPYYKDLLCDSIVMNLAILHVVW